MANANAFHEMSRTAAQHQETPSPMSSPAFHPVLRSGLLAVCLLWATAPPARPDERPALKDVFKEHFQIGTAVNRSITTGRAFRRSPEQVAADVALVKAQFGQSSRKMK